MSITHKNTPEGKGVKVINGVHECEASLHRFEKHFYIGSATTRLGIKRLCRRVQEIS
jgi:hypothetical protein